MLKTKAMKKLFAIATLAILFLNACQKNTPPESLATKILPLGASRVQGDPPNYHSYRYKLWKKLVENGWSVDFVGTQVDPKSYPLVSDEVFDPHHEGHSGYTSG